MRCGTKAGAVYHYRHGEKLCRPCLDAQAEYERERRARRPKRPRGSLPEKITAVVESCLLVSPAELSALIPDANPESLRRSMYRALERDKIRRQGGWLVPR